MLLGEDWFLEGRCIFIAIARDVMLLMIVMIKMILMNLSLALCSKTYVSFVKCFGNKNDNKKMRDEIKKIKVQRNSRKGQQLKKYNK